MMAPLSRCPHCNKIKHPGRPCLDADVEQFLVTRFRKELNDSDGLVVRCTRWVTENPRARLRLEWLRYYRDRGPA